MKRLDEVLAELHGASREEVLTWVEARWVRPDAYEDGPLFSRVDVARLRLIDELRHELAIDPDAMPVVLSLLDELYAVRRHLGALARALSEAPDEVRTNVFSRCCVLLREVDNEAEASPDAT